MKYILSKDKTKMTKVHNIEIETIRIPITDKAKLYEEVKSAMNDIPMPEGLDYDNDYCYGIKIIVNSTGNKEGENYGEYKLDLGIQHQQIEQLMNDIMFVENIILPTQEDFEKIRGEF